MALTKITPGVTDDSFFNANKNLLINGDFRIWQRGVATVTSGNYHADRWAVQRGFSGTGVMGSERSTDVPIDQGFKYSLKLTVNTTEASLSATTRTGLGYAIETNDSQLLIDEIANSGENVTMSFWAKFNAGAGSSIGFPATFSANLRDYFSNIHSLDFNIAADNVWEKITLTFPSSSLTWADNGNANLGTLLQIALAVGSSKQITPGSWTTRADDLVGSSNTDNFMDDTGNEFYVTGLQLEIGDSATSFEFRDYAMELQKCHRYYERRNYDSVTSEHISGGVYTTSTVGTMFFHYSEKRTSPSISFTAAGTFKVVDQNNSTYTCSSIAAGAIGKYSATINTWTSAVPSGGVYFTRDGSDTTYIEIDSEIGL